MAIKACLKAISGDFANVEGLFPAILLTWRPEIASKQTFMATDEKRYVAVRLQKKIFVTPAI